MLSTCGETLQEDANVDLKAAAGRTQDNLGGEQGLSVVDHVPRCDSDGNYANFGGGAGQGVVSDCLAQVLGDAKTEAVGQDPGT